MAIVKETINLNDGTSFDFKYDDEVITRTGTDAYKHDALTDNFYTAYEVAEINKTISAGYTPYNNENLTEWNNKLQNPFIWNGNDETWSFNKSHFNDLTYFGHVVLIYKKPVPYTTSHTFHLITEIDVSRLVCHYVVNNIDNRYYIKTDDNDTSREYCDILNVAKTEKVGSIGLVPFTVTDEGTYLRPFLTGEIDDYANALQSNWSSGDITNRSNYYNDNLQGLVYTMFTDNNIYVGDTRPHYITEPINDDYSLVFYAGGRSGFRTCWTYLTFISENALLKQLALRGLAFEYNETRYYPIINGGKVIGYTEDIKDSGDYKDYDGIHSHFIPSDREDKPSGDDDDLAEMEIGGGTGIGGITNYWLLTQSQLEDFSNAISNNAPFGYSADNSIVSLYGIAVDTNLICPEVLQDFQIKIRIGDKESPRWETGAYGKPLVSQQNKFTISGITIHREHNNFLDYAPYTNIEIFLPLCGWMPLPNSVIGRALSVDYTFDITTCTCKAHVKSGGATVAEKTGTIGASVPLSNINSGLKGIGIIQGLTQVASGIIPFSSGAITAEAGAHTVSPTDLTGIDSGYTQASYGLTAILGGATQAVSSSTHNFTTTIGSHGDRTTWGDGSKIYVKVTTPISNIPDDYGKIIGFICNKSGRLGDWHGFTVIDDPKIECYATEVEKEELRSLMSSGIILPGVDNNT